MGVSFTHCPNCKTELAIESVVDFAVNDVSGLDSDALDGLSEFRKRSEKLRNLVSIRRSRNKENREEGRLQELSVE